MQSELMEQMPSLPSLRDKGVCMEVPQMAREVQGSDSGETDLYTFQ